ncbi:hypothetical protein ACFYPT_40550 [Streptomyces sp. NPDC005529]|uniref:hypothetical protein n=1 Tax=unclassified Streptomyces TaxID=2593676 RepID=UPI0033BA91E1
MGIAVPDPGVFFSSAQMYQELSSLRDGVTRIETKLDGIGQGSPTSLERGKDVADHESRLRTVERARWPMAAIAGLAGAGTGVIALFAH